MIQKSKIENAIPEERKRKKELSKTDSEETDFKDKPKKKKKKNGEKEDKKVTNIILKTPTQKLINGISVLPELIYFEWLQRYYKLYFLLIFIFRKKSKFVKMKKIKIQKVSDLLKKKKIIKNGEPRLKERFDKRLKKKELI